VSVDSVNATLYTLGVAPFNREIDVYAYKSGNQVLEMHFCPLQAHKRLLLILVALGLRL